MGQGKGAAAVGKTLERLVAYTLVHFAHEERIQLDCGYPDYAAHKAQHDELARQVQHYQTECRAGRKVTVQVLHFLKEWLVQHIQNSDARLLPYVKQKVA